MGEGAGGEAGGVSGWNRGRRLDDRRLNDERENKLSDDEFSHSEKRLALQKGLL